MVLASPSFTIHEVVLGYMDDSSELYECESAKEVGGIVECAIEDRNCVYIQVNKNLDTITKEEVDDAQRN